MWNLTIICPKVEKHIETPQSIKLEGKDQEVPTGNVNDH